MAAVEKNLEKVSPTPSNSDVDALEASTGINEKKLLRKLDLKLLPPLTLLYLLSFLDRSNGKDFEKSHHTHMTDQTSGDSGQCSFGRLGQRFAYK